MRCDSTTPLGRPVLPLVKNTTCVCALPSGPTASRRRPATPDPQRRTASSCVSGASPTPDASAAWGSSAISSVGLAYSSTSAASSAPRRAFTGMNAAPRRASASKIGMASSDVSPHHATRSPSPMPREATARATWLARASSSPKVRASSASVAARCRGVARAACRTTSPTSRSGAGRCTLTRGSWPPARSRRTARSRSTRWR